MGSRKGNRLNTILMSNFKMLKSCSESGALFLPVLWRGETPLGALASLIDPDKKSFLFYVGGRDETFNNPPPGLVLHAHSIRHAIEGGFKMYDFLRGNEPYKYSLATVERRISCITVTTRHGSNLHDKFDPRSLPEVFERTTALHQAGRLKAAELGYRQIPHRSPLRKGALLPWPVDGDQWPSRRRNAIVQDSGFRQACLRKSLAEAWAIAGSQGTILGCGDAYREAIALRPGLALAHNKIGNALFKLGEFDAAIAAFDKAIELQPGYIEAEVSRGNTLHMLGTLPAEKQAHYAALNVRLGDKFKKNGAVSFAIHCYRQAITMKQDLVQAHYRARARQSDRIRSLRHAAELAARPGRGHAGQYQPRLFGRRAVRSRPGLPERQAGGSIVRPLACAMVLHR